MIAICERRPGFVYGDAHPENERSAGGADQFIAISLARIVDMRVVVAHTRRTLNYLPNAADYYREFSERHRYEDS